MDDRDRPPHDGSGAARSSVPPAHPSAQGRSGAADVGRLALKLGVTAFGGPAAHIAMLRAEVVDRRHWLTEAEFLDLLGATNLIPGPNSTEMVIHVGYRRAGWRGLVVAGALFILPAALMVLAFAWAYVRFGTYPATGWLLYGVKPVVIAVVTQALWQLGRTAVKGPLLAVLGLAVLILYLVGVNELALLVGCGLVAALIAGLKRPGSAPSGSLPAIAVLAPAAPAVAAPFSLFTLFLTFLKIGAVLYGSGYVLLAFLRGDFVNRLHWLTDRQLLDAVAIGQFTPGPVFTTATFVGYLVGSWWGALLATVGIFLPSFLYVAAVRPLVPRLRRSPLAGAALDGVNVAALALMAAVLLDLGRAALVDPLTVALAIASLLVLRARLNSAWLVLAGGLIGVVSHALR